VSRLWRLLYVGMVVYWLAVAGRAIWRSLMAAEAES
jgi:hypothetical protein